MSYILDALRRADSERERGTVPGLHAQTIAPDAADADSERGTTPWPWVVVGALALALVGLLAWHLLTSDASPPPIAQPAPQPVTPAPAPVAVAPAPVAPPVTEKPVFAPTALPEPVAAPKAAPPLARVETPASAPAGEARVYTLNELPDNIRRELPTLTIGGSIDSANAANRMLIINGQLFHEGDKLAADLSLEQIKLKTAVLKYKGYRYSVNF
ncbi:MAG TPA: general secretion pathway protein GspB [Albitalea sp.]|nr:general secretion pathway protein GspB [Albitalea sp.]